MYHQMKKQAVVETLQTLQAFSDKFPTLAVNQINFYELAKHYQKNPKDFISMVVFMDCMNHMNERSENENSYYLDLAQVKQITVRRNKEQWVFDVYKNTREKVRLSHVYHHRF